MNFLLIWLLVVNEFICITNFLLFLYLCLSCLRIRRMPISFVLQLSTVFGQLKIQNNIFWIRFEIFDIPLMRWDIFKSLEHSCLFYKSISFIKWYSFYEICNNSKLCIYILYFYLFFSFLLFIHTYNTYRIYFASIHCNQQITDFFFFSYRYIHILHLQTRICKTKANTVFIRLFSTKDMRIVPTFVI